MTRIRQPITMVALLSLANDKGEIGYAYGEGNIDLPTVEEAEAKGFIRYAWDASRSRLLYGEKAQQRTIYAITQAGRDFLAENKSP